MFGRRFPGPDEPVITSHSVLTGGRDIQFVTRLHDDLFQFLSLSDEDEKPVVVHAAHVLDRDPTARSCGRLRLGEMAYRASAEDRLWARYRFFTPDAFDTWISDPRGRLPGRLAEPP